MRAEYYVERNEDGGKGWEGKSREMKRNKEKARRNITAMIKVILSIP